MTREEFEHLLIRHGTDVALWPNETAALAFRDDLAREQWAKEFPDELLPATAVGAVYFDRLMAEAASEESFALYPQELDLSPVLAALPPPATAAPGEPTAPELLALTAAYAARGYLLFQSEAARGTSTWTLTRRHGLTGMLHRDFATFRDVDFAIRLYVDWEQNAGRSR